MRRGLWIAGIGSVVAGSVLVIWAVRARPQIRGRLVAALNERFASKVDLQSLEVTIVPRPGASGSGLTIRHNGRTDVPPLIAVDAFEASAGLVGLLRTPLRLRNVTLDGLQIRVPPGGLKVGTQDEAHEAHPERPSPIVIDQIRSRAARLEIASRKPGRLPRTFEIHDLVMHDFGDAAGARFTAGLTNPVPRGRIGTSGIFGPWHADEPGLTPVSGDYTFANADMNVIKGIGGILSSIGSYGGQLDRIEVGGQTDTPDFSLDLAGQPVRLATRFKVVVDGTNGDTRLERVEATLGESVILARGAVVRTEDVKGRHIALDIEIDRARLEDFMRLAVKAVRPPITGRVDVVARMVLPAGEADVIDRLQFDGRFRLAQARFTNVDVQRKIATLSVRGKGDEAGIPDGRSVVSNLGGRFVMKNAQLTFSELTFGVPGAVVELAGTYDLHAETIAFTGYLLTDATLADMTSGVKSVLARLAQPLFRRPGGGSRLPIRISGPRSNPTFGLDARRVFRRG